LAPTRNCRSNGSCPIAVARSPKRAPPLAFPAGRDGRRDDDERDHDDDGDDDQYGPGIHRLPTVAAE
jgi:hypothetical protein